MSDPMQGGCEFCPAAGGGCIVCAVVCDHCETVATDWCEYQTAAGPVVLCLACDADESVGLPERKVEYHRVGR